MLNNFDFGDETENDDVILCNQVVFQQTLQLYKNNLTISVDRYEIAPATELFTSYMSQVKKYKLFGTHGENHEDYQMNIIIKLLPSELHQSLYRSHIAMENECKVYTAIFPMLENYSSGLPIPKCLVANNDFIILEDLCWEGFEYVNPSIQGLTINQCESVLKALGRLHAASFVFKHKDPISFSYFANLTKEILYDQVESELLKHQTDYLENLLLIYLNEPYSRENEITVNIINDLIKYSKEDIRGLLFNPPEHSVLCHGDLQSTNILLKAKQAKFVDFQQMRYNSVASDLVYLLYVNLQPDERVNNMERLLTIYLKSLLKFIKAEGVDLSSVLTAEWLRNEIERYSVYGIVYSLWIIPMFYYDNKNEEVSKELLSKHSKKNLGDSFKERSKKLLYYFIQSLM